MPVEQLRSQQRHERILDAAVRVFSDKGYHGTLVDEIALEAETSKGGVYFHFPNKQAIFMALLDRLARMLRERIEAAVAVELVPIARAETALKVVLDTFGGHPRLARLFMIEALPAEHDSPDRSGRSTRAVRAVDRARPRAVATAIERRSDRRTWRGVRDQDRWCWRSLRCRDARLAGAARGGHDRRSSPLAVDGTAADGRLPVRRRARADCAVVRLRLRPVGAARAGVRPARSNRVAGHQRGGRWHCVDRATAQAVRRRVWIAARGVAIAGRFRCARHPP